MRRTRTTFLGALGTVGLAAGCSLVNALDEVTPADDGIFTGVARPDASTLLIEDGGGPTTTSDARDTGPTSTTFSPLVVSGEVRGDGGVLGPVLTVLDSKTGREVGTRERMWVAGVAHDAPRDVWYIFEAASYYVAGANEPVKLHVRKLDPVTAAWTELASVDAPPLVYYDAIAVTNERVTFVAHPLTGTTQYRMVTIDTTALAAPKANSTIALTQLPRGLIATRSAAGAGGYVNLLNVGAASPASDGGAVDAGVTDCTGSGQSSVCIARIRQYLVPNTVNGQPVLVDTLKYGQMAGSGQPAYASSLCAGPDDITVLPSADGNQHVWSRAYLETQSTDLRTFTMSKNGGTPTLLRKAAIDSKRKIVFVVEANSDTNLHAVPLDPTMPDVAAALRHSGQAVYYDPSSETVFSPFNQGDGFTFSAFRVLVLVASGTRTLALQERSPATDWTPPTDLRPVLLGIKSPAAECQ